MSARYHVNPDTGNPNKCSAVKQCPFGGEESHFETKAEASANYESKQDSQNATSMKKEKKSANPHDFATLHPEWANLPPSIEGTSFSALWDKKFGDYLRFRAEYGDADPEDSMQEFKDLIEPEPMVFVTESYSEHLNSKEDLTPRFLARYGGKITGDKVLHISIRLTDACECMDTVDQDHKEDCPHLNLEALRNHSAYIHDAEDSENDAWTDLYFNAPDEDKIAELYENNERIKRIDKQKNIYEDFEKGEMAPWTALEYDNRSVRSKIVSYQNERRRLKDRFDNIEKMKTQAARIRSVISSANRGILNLEDAEGLPLDQYERRYLEEQITKTIESKEAREKMEVAYKNAEELEDGPLKNWLLEDRGTFKYTVKEKVGRRNVDVQKIGHRGSRLGSELESAQKDHENQKEYLKRRVAPLEKTLDRIVKSTMEHEEKVVNVLRMREDAWAIGWHGKSEDLPKAPKTF